MKKTSGISLIVLGVISFLIFFFTISKDSINWTLLIVSIACCFTGLGFLDNKQPSKIDQIKDTINNKRG